LLLCAESEPQVNNKMQRKDIIRENQQPTIHPGQLGFPAMILASLPLSWLT
jgi:hypothetical protein